MTDPAPEPAAPSEPIAPRSITRWFSIGAIALLWVGAAASLWAVLCRQSPGSPYLVRGYYEAVEALSIRAWVIALATLLFARIARPPRPSSARSAPRWRLIFALWCAGTLGSLGAMSYSAATGISAVQVRDSGQQGHRVLWVRWAGDALLLACLALSQRSVIDEPAP